MPYCQGIEKPVTYVPKFDAERRRAWFIENKYVPLLDYLRKPETLCLSYQAGHFKDLFEALSTSDGVRIYFAAYSDEGNANVPPGYGNLITLVYAPVTAVAHVDTYVDSGTFYILNPGVPHTSIPRSLASEWVSNYQSIKLPILTAVSGVHPSDTKSLLFTKKQVESVIIEIGCQMATGVRIYLSSYTDDEPPSVDPDFRGRLMVQFVLTEPANGSQRDFYIDERPGFSTRPDPGVPALDTGSPCPPAQCAGSTLPS
ncbi:MAG TPA: hypothetical protein VD993_15535 [Chitinophagaceae bacterium]|nr:hypothetical protein [Chitinophagaceae bacterium]